MTRGRRLFNKRKEERVLNNTLDFTVWKYIWLNTQKGLNEFILKSFYTDKDFKISSFRLKNAGDRKCESMCTVSDACPAAVCETLVQQGEAPQSGGGNPDRRNLRRSFDTAWAA